MSKKAKKIPNNKCLNCCGGLVILIIAMMFLFNWSITSKYKIAAEAEELEWLLYENAELGFSVEYPSIVSEIEETNGFGSMGSKRIKFEVENESLTFRGSPLAKGLNHGIVELHYTSDTVYNGCGSFKANTSVNGIEAEICPQEDSGDLYIIHTLNYMIPHKTRYLNIEFFGDSEMDEVEVKILNSFKVL